MIVTLYLETKSSKKHAPEILEYSENAYRDQWPT